ncbi:MAG: zinc ribbon domain-containing protein [Phycisphaerae bacterium]|nr:zinc ribbon domain-containing protein [Phycisphaerae bacterium]
MEAGSNRPGSAASEAVVGRIETDRFCDECGFNMRTAPVHRDDRTRLLLARCTECGRIHHAGEATTAGRVWLNRLGVFAVFWWMLAVLIVTFLLLLLETGMQMSTLDALTDGGGRSGRSVRDDVEHLPEFMALVLGVSAAAGFVMVCLYACAAHHWKRIFHVMLAAVLPLAPMAVAWRAWVYEAPNLERWGWQFLLLHASVQVAGGLVAALYGRAVVRVMATVLLPPRTRALLGFLWIADGKPPPGTVGGSAKHG